MESHGADISGCFDELCQAFAKCTNILPLDLQLLHSLTSVRIEILDYLSTTTSIKLPCRGSAKISFMAAIVRLVDAVNQTIEAFRAFISTLQAAAIVRILAVDTLLPLDLILLIGKLGYIVYDKQVGRILLGPVRIRGVPIDTRTAINVIAQHQVYQHLDSCIGLGDFYECDGALFTVGSVHLREFSVSAVKKFINDIWDNSSLR